MVLVNTTVYRKLLFVLAQGTSQTIGPDMSPLPCLRVRRGLVRAPPTPPAPVTDLVSFATAPEPGNASSDLASGSVAVGVGNPNAERGGIGSPDASIAQVAELYPRTSAVFAGGLVGRNAFLSNKQFLRRLHRSAAAAATETGPSVSDPETPRRSFGCGVG